MRDQGQRAAGAIRLDDNNRASSCFPLQFSHIDNRLWGGWCVRCVCVFLGGCSVHNKCFHNNGLRTGKQLAVMKRDHLRCRSKDNGAPCCFFPHFFIESFIREKKKQLIKPKSNPNIHRCTDSFSKITHTEQRVRGVTMSSSALKQREVRNEQKQKEKTNQKKNKNKLKTALLS